MTTKRRNTREFTRYEAEVREAEKRKNAAQPVGVPVEDAKAAKIEAATETAKAIKKGKKEKATVTVGPEVGPVVEAVPVPEPEPVVAEAPVATSTDETTNG